MSRKNKGIVIELTALLDVILILLFLVMMQLKKQSEEVRADAAEQTADMEIELEAAEEAKREAEERAALLQEDLNSARDDADSLAEALAESERAYDELQKRAEKSDNMAYANQNALDGYAEGNTIMIYLNADRNLQATRGAEVLAEISAAVPNRLSDSLLYAFAQAGIRTEDVTLCAVVYDGDSALFQDVSAVREAVGQLTATYPHLYCTYLNTSVQTQQAELP